MICLLTSVAVGIVYSSPNRVLQVLCAKVIVDGSVALSSGGRAESFRDNGLQAISWLLFSVGLAFIFLQLTIVVKELGRGKFKSGGDLNG
jgi:hypothetical protein